MKHGYFDWACFSAQQAAEKAVKAVLFRHGAEVWGHSVADLLEGATAFAVLDTTLMDAALELDKVYIASRYPDAHPSGAPCSRYTESKLRDRWKMVNSSSRSVRIIYPPFDRETLLRMLHDRLPSLMQDLAVTRAVLFGSWAKGRATAYSDIDVLVVYSGETREDAYLTVRGAFAIRGLEPHVYTEMEATVMQSTLDRMTREGIELL